MKHAIPEQLNDPHRDVMAEAVQTCVHCGFCLPACPTYQVLGQEVDSPRGRIVLMKEVLEGALPLASAMPHIDRCLGCLGCETACPSGVRYRELISPFRRRASGLRRPSLAARLRRMLLLQTLPYPERFRAAALAGSLARPLRSLLPGFLRPMLDLLPDRLPDAQRLPSRVAPAGTRRGRVHLLAGCAQQVLAPSINAATVEVLRRNGVEVIIPPEQGCCGALAWHVGAGREAQAAAIRNLDAFPAGDEPILTNAAGCGSGLHEYPLILQGTPHEERARAFAKRVVDVSEYLDRLGIVPLTASRPVVIAMHDACHLSHGQGVRSAPRNLLRRIPGVRIVEVPDGEICCGSAGTYNVDQPAIAADLGRRKAAAIRSTGAEMVALGNIGCLTQIQTHLGAERDAPPVLHTIEILARAYRGEL